MNTDHIVQSSVASTNVRKRSNPELLLSIIALVVAIMSFIAVCVDQYTNYLLDSIQTLSD